MCFRNDVEIVKKKQDKGNQRNLNKNLNICLWQQKKKKKKKKKHAKEWKAETRFY